MISHGVFFRPVMVDDKWQKVHDFEDVRLLDFSPVEWAVKMELTS